MCSVRPPAPESRPGSPVPTTPAGSPSSPTGGPRSLSSPRSRVSTPEAWHVTRTLRAMELLAIEPRSAPELADGLGVHVRTARRILKRLESEGYVSVSGDRRRRYRPTMRVVALAGQVVQRAE